jgi:hypothetical protein
MKITFSELKQILIDEFGLEGKQKSLRGTQIAQDVRCLFYRLAFIYCDGDFDNISNFLGRPKKSTDKEIVNARVLMKNAYYKNKVNSIETKIAWKNKH